MMRKNRSMVIFLAALVSAGFSDPCLATNPDVSTIEQPVNLAARSHPGRIPLGRVGVFSNYGSGIQRVISDPRPCPDAAMTWNGGSELDQNLASVFGIGVEAGDLGATPKPPVILRMKSWKPPAYSPYTKDQVLAATLICVLRSTSGTPESPLKIQVVAEGEGDQPLVEKYSGSYVNSPGKVTMQVPPIVVPGTVVETDSQGICWVVFPAVKHLPATPPPLPTLIPLRRTGSDEHESAYFLLPVWDHDSQLELGGWSHAIRYTCYQPRGRKEANSFLREGGFSSYDVTRTEAGDSVSISYPRVSETGLAAETLALVLAAQPTEARPLEVSIHLEENGLAALPAFRSAAGWQETRTNPHRITLTCDFVWDPDTRELVKGSVPLLGFSQDLTLVTAREKPLRYTPFNEKTAETVRLRIDAGIHDRSLIAETVMPDDLLEKSGLAHEIGKAGYHLGLASWCAPHAEKNQPDLVPIPGSNLAEFFEMGWSVGRNRGMGLSQEAAAAIHAIDADE
jgi:hypothetical protein